MEKIMIETKHTEALAENQARHIHKTQPKGIQEGTTYQVYDGADLIDTPFIMKEDEAEWLEIQKESGLTVKNFPMPPAFVAGGLKREQ